MEKATWKMQLCIIEGAVGGIVYVPYGSSMGSYLPYFKD